MSARAAPFTSYARPTDDKLTRWLYGRLTARGYRFAYARQLIA